MLFGVHEQPSSERHGIIDRNLVFPSRSDNLLIDKEFNSRKDNIMSEDTSRIPTFKKYYEKMKPYIPNARVFVIKIIGLGACLFALYQMYNFITERMLDHDMPRYYKNPWYEDLGSLMFWLGISGAIARTMLFARKPRESLPDIDRRFREAREQPSTQIGESLTPVSKHFLQITTELSDSAQANETKASTLLERGTLLAKQGVALYVALAVIIQWYVGRSGGMRAGHFVAAVSATVLFIFIEFISAWHLRQYRYLIDAANYNKKLKMIFDRYYAQYLAIERAFSADTILQHDYLDSPLDAITPLLENLSGPIHWPGEGWQNTDPGSFATETMTAMMANIQALSHAQTELIKGSPKNDQKAEGKTGGS